MSEAWLWLWWSEERREGKESEGGVCVRELRDEEGEAELK